MDALTASHFRQQLTAGLRRAADRPPAVPLDAHTSGHPSRGDDLVIGMYRTEAEYRRHGERFARAADEIDAIERQLILCPDGAYFVDGYCAVCRSRSQFQVGYMYSYEQLPTGQPVPNWREHLNCSSCQLVSRNRFVLHAVRDMLAPANDLRVYATEQVTPLFAWLRRHYPRLVGSEYLGDEVAPGATQAGIRNEDVTRLTFQAGAFDLIVSCDVVQHVGNDVAAFAEFHRCLARGGMLALTTPFALSSAANIVRSRLAANGQIEHLVPPEYQGNPLGEDKPVLWFRSYGWELLAQLRAVGFADACVVSAWSRDLCYLGWRQILLVLATKG